MCRVGLVNHQCTSQGEHELMRGEEMVWLIERELQELKWTSGCVKGLYRLRRTHWKMRALARGNLEREVRVRGESERGGGEGTG